MRLRLVNMYQRFVDRGVELPGGDMWGNESTIPGSSGPVGEINLPCGGLSSDPFDVDFVRC